MDKGFEGSEGAAISRRRLVKYAGAGATLAAASPLVGPAAAADDTERTNGGPSSLGRVWRAGDHHVHSEYSGTFDTTTNPPTFQKGGDAVYPIVTNAIMAKHFGLSWVMCTDHGGPTHCATRSSPRLTPEGADGKGCGSPPTSDSSMWRQSRGVDVGLAYCGGVWMSMSVMRLPPSASRMPHRRLTGVYRGLASDSMPSSSSKSKSRSNGTVRTATWPGRRWRSRGGTATGYRRCGGEPRRHTRQPSGGSHCHVPPMPRRCWCSGSERSPPGAQGSQG